MYISLCFIWRAVCTYVTVWMQITVQVYAHVHVCECHRQISGIFLTPLLQNATLPSFSHGCWELNLCPRACVASNLLTELPPQLPTFAWFSGFNISFRNFLFTRNKHLPDVSMIDEKYALITSSCWQSWQMSQQYKHRKGPSGSRWASLCLHINQNAIHFLGF